jgi:Tol biopolymer transport system component
MMRGSLALVIPLLLASQPGIAQVPRSTHRVHFTTEEGSWLSFDLSRDGRWIVLDLLGQLWRLPANGGTAEPLTNAVADSAELLDPAFSPDGRSILTHGESHGQLGVFQLSATGGDIRWIAPDALEGNRHPVHSPAWSPDGERFLHARREGRGTVLIEREVPTGVERRIAVTGATGSIRDGVTYSTDGSEIFFHTHDGGPGILPQSGRIWRAPTVGGAARPVTPPGVMARAPAPSPDGRQVAYFVVDSTNRAQVWLQNLDDSVGVQVAAGRQITPTRIRWLPSSNALLYVDSGRLWRLDVGSSVPQPVPFRATVDFVRAAPDPPSVRFQAPGERVQMRTSSGIALAPDGRAMAIIALNRLWVVSTDSAGAVPRAVVSLPPTASSPAWSPDGRSIAWHAGRFFEEDLFITDTATRTSRRVTSWTGSERFPVWSPDGRHLLVGHGISDSLGRRFRIRSVPVRDGATTVLEETIDIGGAAGIPQWSPNGDVVFNLGPSGTAHQRPATLRSRDGAPLSEVQGLHADATSTWWLPGDTLVFLADRMIWCARLNVATGVVEGATPLTDRLATQLAASPSGHILYSGEDGYEFRRIGSPARRLGWPITYTVPLPRPLVVRNVRIIDGTGSAASTPRDIVIERGRVTRTVAAGTAAVPDGADLLDAAGRMAMPGLIDLHPHFFSRAQNRGVLYFGVTTVRGIGGYQQQDPDAVAAGIWQGPRGTRGERVSPAVAADPGQLTRTMSMLPAYGIGILKIYSNSAWASQVRLATAAHAVGARATGHCAYPMTLLAAGIDSKEHLAGGQCTLRDGSVWYDDLIQLYTRSGTAIVSTLALFTVEQRLSGVPVSLPAELQSMYGAPERVIIEGSFEVWGVTAAARANTDHTVDAARKLHRAGAVIGAGTDLHIPDGMHYELEELVAAGFSPLEAIRAATSVAARIMGAGGEVGQIAPGYLADLVLLDADPTADIRNSRRIWRVIQGGRITDRHALVSPDEDTLVLPR